MSNNGDRVPTRTEAERIALGLERILLAIEVHGAKVAWEDRTAFQIVWLKWNHWWAYRQVQEALREARKRRWPTPHMRDCACWNCLARTHMFFVRRQAECEAGSDHD
jgi:hypothetical protein